MLGLKSAPDHLERSPLEIAKSGTFRGKKPDFGVGGPVGEKLDSEKSLTKKMPGSAALTTTFRKSATVLLGPYTSLWDDDGYQNPVVPGSYAALLGTPAGQRQCL